MGAGANWYPPLDAFIVQTFFVSFVNALSLYKPRNSCWPAQGGLSSYNRADFRINKH
jgi:hypothetical protein